MKKIQGKTKTAVLDFEATTSVKSSRKLELFSLESWPEILSKAGTLLSRKLAGTPLESWNSSRKLAGNPLESWPELLAEKMLQLLQFV